MNFTFSLLRLNKLGKYLCFEFLHIDEIYIYK